MYSPSPAHRRRLVAVPAVVTLSLTALALGAGTSFAEEAGSPTPNELVYLAPEYSSGDLTGDQRVDASDLGVLIAALGATSGGPGWDAVAKDDFDGDARITISDVATLSRQAIYNDGDFQVVEAGVIDAQASMEAGKLSAVELTQKYLDRIAAYDSATVDGNPATALNSIIQVNDHALADAAALDEERRTSGPRSLLHGIPVIVKDNFNTFDAPTTVGCKCLDGFVPSSDAFMVKKLREAGAIILAKANLTEFASGYTGQSAYKRSSNAYVAGAESGGSSAGTGAAIAANLGMIGLGSDTGGSIQVPGAYQGLADVYQSFGLVSREGIAPLAGDQDRGGPLTRSLADSVIMLDLYAGSDPNDATTVDADADREDSYAAYLDKTGLAGARIGYVSTIGSGSHIGTNPAINRIFQEAKATMAAQGATLVDIGQLRMQTTSSGSTREFGHDIGEFLETYVPEDSTYPGNAEELKALLTEHPELSSISGSVIDRINRIPDYDAFMETHDDEIAANQATINGVLEANDLDAIVYPTVARFGVPGGSGYANVMIASLSGHPSVSVPSGWSQASDYVPGGVMPASAVGMPTTVSFLGAMNSDAQLIKLGYAFEQATKHRTAPNRYPDLAGPAAAAPEVTGEESFDIIKPSKSPTPGETATVSIGARNIPDAYSYLTEITFDPSKVTPLIDDVTSGTSGITEASVSGDTLTVVHTKLGSSPAASGDFTLAGIPFTARSGNGLSSVAVKSISIVASDNSMSSFMQPAVTSLQSAAVSAFVSSTKTVSVIEGESAEIAFVTKGSGVGEAEIEVSSRNPAIATATAPASVPLSATSALTVAGVKPGNTTVQVHADSGKVLTIAVKVVAKN